MLQQLKARTLRAKSGLAIVALAALLLLLTIVSLYWFARKSIAEEVNLRAQAELQLKSREIENVMGAVEVAASNMVWAVEQRLAQPDSIFSIARQLVSQNATIVGSGIAFVADYYPQQGRWFEPYVKQLGDGSFVQRQIGSARHDYLQTEWFLKGLEAEKGAWSEPYYDEAGAGMMLCTYALPVHDASGRTVGVLGADVSLQWLSTTINAHPVSPSSYNVMISRSGQLMACPVESLVMRRTIQEVTHGMEDTTVRQVNRQMMEGMSGQSTIQDEKGRKNYVFYAPIKGDAGWSMAIVCPDREIYYGLRQMTFNLTLLMLLGLALLVFIIYRAARNFGRLQYAKTEKERIASELRIASGIQRGMLPKTFPPFPERDDVEVYGSLVSAKEVGGDLYDFFIRDEKLFFCIGDVSGKGVPASLMMAVTRSLFRVASAQESVPSRIVSVINDAMTDMNEENMFVTFFVGVLDLPTGRLHYCNAGHPAPLLIGQGVGVLPVETNVPIGLVSDWKYTPQSALVLPGTSIFLYTDGLTEAENHLHTQFGEQRMKQVAGQALADGKQDPTLLIQSMTQGVNRFVDGAQQSDDLTMLAVQYTKEHRDVRLQRTLLLTNDVGQIGRLSDFVSDICQSLQFTPAASMQMNLALEEAVANVVNYAYPSGTKGEIEVVAEANDVRLKFVITDQGIPFDPTTQKDVDTSLSLDERPVGGLGIHLVRQLMDSINYERIDGQNILTLRKKLK